VTALEIAVTSAAGTRTARANGATRVELCAALELGGVTPSAGLVEGALAEAGEGFEVHALVRPRPGDFGYDAADVATSRAEVTALARAGVHGVVVGALTPGGRVDLQALRALAWAAREVSPGITVTFHRALDQAESVVAAFEEIAESELVDRVLTSGGAARAIDGLPTIGELVRVAAGRVEVMAGGGVGLDDIAPLVDAGAAAVHLSAKRRGPGSARVSLGARDDAPPPGGGRRGRGPHDPGSYFVTDGDLVAAALKRLSAAG